ncbi:leucine-rich repeat receptor-like protein kinase family protein [Striga asiatica]|uniref:Leucine-rich repeat receptor-like protein kinase family protein n=1 Tax=Striga asiatica TaxID=4170 RepID=A0A5A7NWZ4_STRAF|nr:leucine-rich repeat receptor-like protein kinase family protein [Striga asiatica]
MPMSRQFSNATPYFPSFLLLCFLLFLLKILPNAPLPATAEPSPEARLLFSWIHPSSPSSSPPPVLSGWNPTDPEPCKWAFISCSPDRHVSQIDIRSVPLSLPFPPNLTAFASLDTLIISGANLTGNIPPDIGYLVSLKKIDLSYNNLDGNIPATIGNLKNLEELILNSNQLTGKIPGELGSCSGLRNLALFDNRLSGAVPRELGSLSALEILRAGGNQDIAGEIPDEISNCGSLQVLGLAETRISGAIPASFGRLRSLQVLSLYTTMLSGEIPPEISNCTELVGLYLYENSLTGPIPKEIGKLLKLERLLLWQNNFAGSIPEEIGNCRNLVIFDVSLNFLTGIIPESFGNLTSLEEFMLSSNNVSGSIPAVLSNATSLVQFQVDSNQISGSIPPEFGSFANLQIFFAWDNKLEGSIPATLSGCKSIQALDLSRNSLTGILPPSIFELGNLTKLLLIYNDISGPIPPQIGNCKSLYRLRLAGNRINGQIPREIGLLSNLSFLDLSTNHLSGILPDEIGNCGELQMLNVAGNLLTGNLPSSLSYLSKLEVLDISTNKLVGPIPGSFGELFSLNTLSLAGNSLSGEIPSSLGRCSRLQMLDLSQNQLFGSIPPEIFEIEALEIALNLSWNSLTGKIPPQVVSLDKLSVLDLSHNSFEGDLMSLSRLVNLVSLNVSYNNFTGYLPDNKLFRQLSDEEIAGNRGLCSGGRESCFLISNAENVGKDRMRRVKWPWRLKLAISSLVVVTIALGILGILVVVRVRRMGREGKDSELGNADSFSWKFTPFQTKLNFSVEQVLKCLVEGNAIGKGCSGVVYRAELENGEVIAVKKLWPSTTTRAGNYNDGASGVRDSFSTEVKTLGSIRHKNIVKFLGCCSNRNTRLLMYDYMPNGSLGSLLHEHGRGCLEWDVRYRVILGSAQGLAYLHHDCVPPILHRDIKANNILIGPDFEPYIADFGIAKPVDGGDFARSSNAVAGSYGYIAPEYGYSMKITEKSDVYSYGVVVLEVLTGKQPIDPTIPDGAHIVDWVKQRRRQGEEVLDPSMMRRPEPEIEEMMQTLGVAMLCVNPMPEDRPTMKDIAAMLKEIRHEREEVPKVDVVKVGADESKSCGSSKMEGLYSSSNKSSFSGSSLLLHSVAKFGFNK